MRTTGVINQVFGSSCGLPLKLKLIILLTNVNKKVHLKQNEGDALSNEDV